MRKETINKYLKAQIINAKPLPRLHMIDLTIHVAYRPNPRDNNRLKHMRFTHRISERKSFANIDLLETFAAKIVAGSADVDLYKEFYEGVDNYPYSKVDFNHCVETYKKAQNFFYINQEIGNESLYSFVSCYFDEEWLEPDTSMYRYD